MQKVRLVTEQIFTAYMQPNDTQHKQRKGLRLENIKVAEIIFILIKCGLQSTQHV